MHNSIAKHDYEFDMNAFLCERKIQTQHNRQAGRQAVIITAKTIQEVEKQQNNSHENLII